MPHVAWRSHRTFQGHVSLLRAGPGPAAGLPEFLAALCHNGRVCPARVTGPLRASLRFAIAEAEVLDGAADVLDGASG